MTNAIRGDVAAVIGRYFRWLVRFAAIAGAVACAWTAIYLFWGAFVEPLDINQEPHRGLFVRASTVFEELTGMSSEGTEEIKHHYVPANEDAPAVDYFGRDFLRVTYSDDQWLKNFISAANAKKTSASVDSSPERPWWHYGHISNLPAFESNRRFIFWIDRPNRHLFIFNQAEPHTIF